MSNNAKHSVNEIVTYLKKKNDSDSFLLNLSISGELSNVKVYPSNHMYFDLKDEYAKLSGVMFASNTKSLNFKPTDGDKVVVRGAIKVYQKSATFQVIATKIEKDGFGELFIQFEKNKKILEEEGYFDSKYKRTIPSFPNKVAVIAGHDSAALKDILKTLNSRYKLSQVVVFPTQVQGKDASKKIIEMINLVNNYEFDVILLARGGGSFEDLNAFNDVELAKVIFNSKIPIVTGIGHEIDFTIADFVSDYRSATPTAAAMLISPLSTDLLNQITKYQNSINISFNNSMNLKSQVLDNDFNLLITSYNSNLNKLKNRLDSLRLRLEKNNIKYKLLKYEQFNYEYYLKLTNLITFITEQKKQDLISKYEYLNTIFLEQIKNNKLKVNENIIKLNLLDPNTILDKGYSIVYKDNKVIKDFSKLNDNDKVNIVSKKYIINANVDKVVKNEK